MTPGPQRRRGTLERPGRVAAIGGAAVVCVLAVSGALGWVPFGAAGTTGHDAVLESVQTTSTRHSTATPPAERQHADSRQTDRAASTSRLPADSGAGRRVVYNMSRQRVWLVGADGTVARTYPVSGSRFANLEPGTYSVTSRSAVATAYNSDETMRYMVRFAYGRTAPIGFHSIPAYSDGTLAEPRSQLGTRQSAGCIRQWITDAKALWDFAPVGTTVVVLA